MKKLIKKSFFVVMLLVLMIIVAPLILVEQFSKSNRDYTCWQLYKLQWQEYIW